MKLESDNKFIVLGLFNNLSVWNQNKSELTWFVVWNIASSLAGSLTFTAPYFSPTPVDYQPMKWDLLLFLHWYAKWNFIVFLVIKRDNEEFVWYQVIMYRRRGFWLLLRYIKRAVVEIRQLTIKQHLVMLIVADFKMFQIW